MRSMLYPKKKRPTKNGNWRWLAVKAVPLLLPFLGPAAIVISAERADFRNLQQQHEHEHALERIDIHHNNYRYHNRQLLEHGLRGGDHENENSTSENHATTRNAPSNANTTTTTPTPPIPVSNITIPLHAHSGTHHVHLYIGSPPQRQTLILDTGSRAMAFPCQTCKDCTPCCGMHASPYFDPSQSSTHSISNCGSCLLAGISSCALSNNYCTFSQKYTEGSAWTATEVEDLVWLGSADATESLEYYLEALAVAYPFGCQTSSSGLFRQQYADGILGLSIHETSLVTAIYHEGLIPSNAFSLCFTPQGGVLSLGGSLDPFKYHHLSNANGTASATVRPMRTTPVTQQPHHGYYSVEVISFMVGGTRVVTDATTKPQLLREMNAGKGCILDSGTTDSYFPASLSKAMRKAIIDYGMGGSIGSGEHRDYHPFWGDPSHDVFAAKFRTQEYTYQDFERLFPTITLVFANEVRLDILPQHYMEHVPLDYEGRVVPWTNSRRLTNRLYFEEDHGSVLGANAFFGYEIYFDAGSTSDPSSASAPWGGQRIGIVPADCHAAAKELGGEGGLPKMG